MENIYILPTENPSKLSINNGVLILHRKQWRKNTLFIYITCNEKIKEENYAIALDTNIVFKVSKNDLKGIKKFPHLYKKIILTTDQNLIKDGIQAIDDEFLEWFVNNPTVNFITISKKHFSCFGECGICNNDCNLFYKIIL